MTLKNYIINTRQKAVQAQRKGDQDTGRGITADLIKGVVIGANGGGFDVQTVDQSGNAARIYQRCYPWPSDQTFEGGEEVWVRLSEDGETAEIVVSGGGGMSCFYAPNDWGVLFG